MWVGTATCVVFVLGGAIFPCGVAALSVGREERGLLCCLFLAGREERGLFMVLPLSLWRCLLWRVIVVGEERGLLRGVVC